MKGWVRVENSYGSWLLMVGLDMGCRKPDAAIRKRIVGGLKLGGKKSHNAPRLTQRMNWTDLLGRRPQAQRFSDDTHLFTGSCRLPV
jgi:hypothetical protein